MEKYEEILEGIKENFNNPDMKKGNFELLKEAINLYSNNEAKIIKEFKKQDKYFIIVWEFNDRYYVSNINPFFMEFDKYKFNDKNAAVFLFKDLTVFCEELSGIQE